MRVIVTGAAGFIGSHLCEAALDAGHEVIGIDCLTDYYDVSIKRAVLAGLTARPGFTWAEQDLCAGGLDGLVELFAHADVVHHLAGQPGVRLSWSDRFADYVERNIHATQRVLEVCRVVKPSRVVFASSSSVYGNAPSYPTDETVLPHPHSPYGVTKLAAEHLCGLYAANWDVPTTALRYFTVYGPRQRPDMGFNKFIRSAIAGEPLTVYGDGEQVRDFTFVADVVAANLAAGIADVAPGTVVNVAGGGSITVNELIATLGTVVGRELATERHPEQPGDVRVTGGTIELAGRLLGWSPRVGIAEGLAAQYAWQSAQP